MKRRGPTWIAVLGVQVVVAAAFATAYEVSSPLSKEVLREEWSRQDPFEPVPIPRTTPLRIEPLYDRPDLVSDEDLAAVLDQVQPRFEKERLSPNHVEHALRTWGVGATFQNPAVMSGAEMTAYLTDHARFSQAWSEETAPLVQERPNGIAINWGRIAGASVHHDHWLASLTEAGAHLETPVYGPSRYESSLYDVVQESLRDFRLDERETEWTAMSFGLWIPPTRSWKGGDGRYMSFDLIARRLMRGQKELGVCSGTHRVYSLMLLVRLDDEFHILSDSARNEVWTYLESVRDAITHSQFEDGHWPTNWWAGAAALEDPRDDPLYKVVITTGHHLEWLAIAPRELHPPEENIRKGMEWIIATTKSQTLKEIRSRYTFFSHVGAALALWRSVRPADFWREWETTHPFDAEREAIRAAAEPAEPEADLAH